MQISLSFITVGLAPEIKTQILYQDMIVDQFECDGNLHQINFIVNDTELHQVQSIAIRLLGKEAKHTQIDDCYHIVQDMHVEIEKIVFNGIDVTEIFCQGAKCYHHDQNGAVDQYIDEFHGYIGCNGTVLLDFYTPLYLWFLEQCQ